MSDLDAALKSLPSKSELSDLKAENERLRKQVDDLMGMVDRKRHERVRFSFAKPRSGKRRGGFTRVTCGDTHGMRVDKAAFAAFVQDLKTIQPREGIHGGDSLDCDGFLSAHKAIGYTSLSEYSYDEDVGAANDQWDAMHEASPKTQWGLIEGNHEYRVRTWCKDNSRNDRDLAYHWRKYGPPHELALEKRGVAWFSRGEQHDGLSKRGTIKRGKMYYVHGDSHAANAAAKHLQGHGGNVTFHHTHRIEVLYKAMEATGVIAAYNCGCLCERHPMWRHSEPSTWSQGYGLEFVEPDGSFLKLVIPIVSGRSYLEPMLKVLGV